MLLQIQNGSLLQFADHTCLFCHDDDHTQVKDFLNNDLDSLARWTNTRKMQVIVKKPPVMWFSVNRNHITRDFSTINSLATVPPILLEGSPLVNVSKHKYLEITIDSNLTWAYHVARNGNYIIIYYIPDCLYNFVKLFTFVYCLCCI